jgi:tetratricopeptide (TPR) repeat protein
LLKTFEGEALVESGHPARARELLDDAIAFAERIETKFQLSVAKRSLSAALLALGEPDNALAVCQEAIQLADEAGELLIKSRACQLLVDAGGKLDRIDRQEALQMILEAIRVQEEFGAEPEQARSYAIYARLLRSQGDMGQAEEYYDRAIDMFTRMGMDWDLAQAGSAR